MLNDLLSLLRRDTGVENIGPEQFSQLLGEEANPVLIDVRTLAEHVSGFIPGSVHIDMMSREFGGRIGDLDREQACFLYCRSGSRSYHVASAMKKMGFTTVYNLSTGVIGWQGSLDTKV